MNAYWGEFIGTTILILMGNGVVANVLLKGTKGHGSGPLMIVIGWGLSVFTAVLCVQNICNAHLNPAVTIGLASSGTFDWGEVPGYIAAQMAGAIVGGTIAFIFYYPHYKITEDADAKLATFCTAPAIRNFPSNLFSEIVGTFVLVYAVLCMVDPKFTSILGSEVTVGLGSIGALRVGLVIIVIGITLGGTTGWAINPARDLGPRIAHFLLPVPGKRDSDWSYAIVPVLGPIVGGLLAAALFSQH